MGGVPQGTGAPQASRKEAVHQEAVAFKVALGGNMVLVWEVQSKWSTEQVRAGSLVVAYNKYLRHAKKELSTFNGLRVSPEPYSIKCICQAI